MRRLDKWWVVKKTVLQHNRWQELSCVEVEFIYTPKLEFQNVLHAYRAVWGEKKDDYYRDTWAELKDLSNGEIIQKGKGEEEDFGAIKNALFQIAESGERGLLIRIGEYATPVAIDGEGRIDAIIDKR